LIYKWDHSREVITDVLVDKYYDLEATGWQLTTAEIQRDVSFIFGESFRTFLKS
jgi:hypothetical protein